MSFPALDAFEKDLTIGHSPWRVYMRLQAAHLNHTKPLPVRVRVLSQALHIGPATIIRALNMLIGRGYLIEHVPDSRGVRSLTLAWHMGVNQVLEIAKHLQHETIERQRQRVLGRIVQRALRRARKRGASQGSREEYAAFVRWTATELVIPCRWCGENTKPGGRHRDHIIPLSRGGADSVANLCVACPDCNMRKGAKLPQDFMARIA